MSAACDAHGCDGGAPVTTRVGRRVLWIVLVLNAVMFVVEGGAGLAADSLALQADALDFLGDSVTYAVSLFVLGMSLRWRASAGLAKGLAMGALGLWVLGTGVDRALHPGLPSAPVMGSVAALALVVNLVSAALLFRFRGGESNIRSIWLCSRNDAIGNLAVFAAAGGVFATDTAWPDLAVAAVMAGLWLAAAVQIVRLALSELVRA
ncbi:MAG: cation transporter [Alphaproteobacteria bacterium]|nr:cation transporter [Alphaproteobacteria bacterium]